MESWSLGPPVGSRKVKDRGLTPGATLKGKLGDPANLGVDGLAVLAGGVQTAGLVRPNVRVKPPAEAGCVSLVRDDALCAADQAYAACRSGSA